MASAVAAPKSVSIRAADMHITEDDSEENGHQRVSKLEVFTIFNFANSIQYCILIFHSGIIEISAGSGYNSRRY